MPALRGPEDLHLTGDAPALYPKLRPGPGLAANLVIANQRARLRGALVELAAERGYPGVTVRGLARLAGVSTKTFYDCFENLSHCFTETNLWVLRRVLHQALAVDDEDEEVQLRARVAAVFTFLGENPKAARLALLESITVRHAFDEQTRAAKLALERLIGQELLSPGPYHSALSQAAFGAGVRLMRSRLLAGRDHEIPQLAEPFARWLMAVRAGGFENEVWNSGNGRDNASIEPGRRTALVGDDRSLLMAAVRKVALRDGYQALTVPAIRREAGVSRRSFDELFDGPSDCFLTALEEFIFDICERAERGARCDGSWECRVVRMLERLTEELARDPAMARLAVAGIVAPGIAGLRRREDIVKRLAQRLSRAAPNANPIDELSAEASVAGVWRIAESHLTDDGADELRGLSGALALLILVPAVGASAAERTIRAARHPDGGMIAPKSQKTFGALP